jgi:uncharacterized protein YutE (UPF0331/DUF86 family)
MGKALAIKGHKTRGKEVIELLEMLGGSNIHNLSGNKNFAYYVNAHENIIRGIDFLFGYEDMKFFTLEEFLEKYPFKVGDRVRIPEYESEVRIDKMYWDGYEIQYEVYTDEVETYSAEELNQWNESNNKSKTQESLLKKNSITISSLCYEDEVELNFSCEYELIERNGKHILIKKKPKYPKNYDECCDMLDADEFIGHELMREFPKLLNARNAYWKIAGEQMGLDKPWKPDWDNLSTNHEFIIINKGCFTYSSRLLVFPTIEMRDAFYDNFKDLIEQCKELL